MLSIIVFILVFISRINTQNNTVTQPPPTPPPPPPTPPPTPNYKAKPTRPDFPGRRESNSRHRLGDWLINGNWKDDNKVSENNREYEYPGYDGFYNNLARPDSGAVDKPLLRRWPAAYKDGSYEPSGFDRPNPFDLSDNLFQGDIGQKSIKGRNALFLFFGQQVVEEILDAQRPACPPEYFNVPIPESHRYRKQFDASEMPLLRTRYDMRTGFSPNNPRQQLNEITPYLDGGLVYGTTKQWSDQLRTYSNGTVDPYGRLASSSDGLFPENNTDGLPMANPPPPFYHADYTNFHETPKVNRFFKLGNPRGNENPFLLTFGVVWFRWHNYLATRIHHHHPKWSSDKIYNEARKWVIATQQRIVVYDWLPVLLGEGLKSYTQYDAGIDPQIDQFFQSAAFRFGHTLVVPGVYLRDYIHNNCSTKFKSWKHAPVRTCNTFWRPQEPLLRNDGNGIELIDIDRLLMGMSVQLTEKEDHVIVEDLRGNVFGPLEFPRRDLMAINIQRGRDHGLPDFNSARIAFGLQPYKNFDSFIHITDETKKKLKELYKNDINNIDIWVGGILETNEGPGQLFKTIILDQFRRIRDGDRFWYQNTANKLFTNEEIARINSISIYDILMAITNMEADDIPKAPFRAAVNKTDYKLIAACNLSNSNMYYHLPQLNAANLNENCTQPTTYDYFYDSEASYILTFLFLGAFSIGTIGVVYLLIHQKENMMKEISLVTNKSASTSFKNNTDIHYPLFVVNEWTGPKYPIRKVVLTLKSDKRQISIACHNGILLRGLDFEQSKKVKLIFITDEPTLIMQCRHNYDLVLKFESDYLRNHFFTEFESSFVTNKRIVEIESLTMTWKSAVKIIVTKDKRQNRLEMFFRVVFAQAFKIRHNKTEILKVDAYVAKEVIDTELTLSEFADSLSMPADNEFVKRMFFLIDKDKNGFISFREFINLLIIFANGTEEEKAKLLFDMYDVDGIGYLRPDDFITMIKSFLETVGGKIDDKDIQRTVEVMMKNARIEHNQNILTFEDFKRMIGDDIKNLNEAKLGFVGLKKQDRGSYLETAKDTIENIYESHELPKFHYWYWQTMTGLTGIVLTLIFIVMYTFALPVIRRQIYNWFWYTHSLYPLFIIFLVLHGTGRLIEPPISIYFLLGPVALFTLDTLVSVSRKKIEIPVINAEILPSNVTKLEFRKPDYFQYKAGQWVRIACLALNKNEYHPFTLSSAPDEDNLTVHIRAVGPWTMNIRSIYDTTARADTTLPKIYLDGPYGEGHQDWSTYDVAILIGGGIGVTPFASILKDVSYRAKRIRTNCKKVYFIWVSRIQKQFEWLVDIIRDVETNDIKNFVSCHIFITQFYEKFDLRTILLYICERHYQRISNKSLFTNLRAVTHFGRPVFSQFFKTVQHIHKSAQWVGVFSCGSPSINTAVDLACSKINQQSEQRFEHHFKNF